MNHCLGLFSGLAGFEPVCGCQGCHQPVVAAIDHPRYGRRDVCKRHVDGQEVIQGGGQS